MNTVNETKTFSSLPEEESALWERMRDTLLCLQTDNSISVKDLASRLAYSTQEFLYLADIFFDNSLDAIREQVQGLNIEEDYTNQVLPFERIPDSSMIDGLEKDVVVIGANNKAEIWNRASWETANAAVDLDEMMSILDTLGF